MSTVESKKRSSLVATAVLALTFLFGAATGLAVARWAPGSLPGRPPHGPLPFDELDLTAGQKAQLSAILKRYHPEFDAVFRSTFPQVRGISERMEAEVREILDAQQRFRLDAIKAKRPPFPAPGGAWQPPPPGFPPVQPPQHN